MSFVRGFIRRPQRVWLRQLNFQVHLWVGLALTLYLVMISVTGGILVFREELETQAGVNPWSNVQINGPQANPADVIAKLRTAFPDARLTSLSAPTQATPVYLANVQSRGKTLGSSRIGIHPVTAEILGRPPRQSPGNRTWLGTVRNLHVTLLSGVTGRQINGVFAACLLLINLTGMVVWWSGLQIWTRGLAVDFARRWRRVNFDLHSAIGFWTLAIVSFWAVSGVYFGFSQQLSAFVEHFSPIISARPPSVRVEPQVVESPPDLRAMLDDAFHRDPGATLREIVFPSGRRSPLEINLQRPGTRGAEFSDTLYFDPYDGQFLTIWRYGVNQSFADWFVWSQIPLHFGTFWGLGVKILWAALALAIPLLCATGAVMYWNRVLRNQWRKIRGKAVAAVV
jgi:uncharacterized iron-regulated membrane protein